MRIAVFCVGNKLMLDDGLGPAVYEELQAYDFAGAVDLFDVGCMSLDLVRFSPDDAARRGFGSQSLHDLRLSDLFDAAALLGYHAQGVCLGMQIENANPIDLTIGLTPAIAAKLPDLVDAVLAELVAAGVEVCLAATGERVAVGYHHLMG